MSEDLSQLRRRLLSLVNGFQVSQAIHAFTILGLPDLIAGGRHQAADLALATGTDLTSVRRLRSWTRTIRRAMP